jgi:hypothetical protein
MSSNEAEGPVPLIVDDATGDRLLIYAANGGAEVQLRVANDSFWATQAQMAQMFGVNVPAISKHLKNIFDEGELDRAATVSNLEKVGIEGGRQVKRTVEIYNLNALISVGYRVGSKQGSLFRIWATDKLLRYLTRGFVIDSQRLKAPDEHDRIAELREIIRDIRASEANVYAELRRICAMCQDYDSTSQQSRRFYATMQAKLYWAVVSGTPSMVLSERADAAAPNMGLQTWPKTDIRQADAVNAKNYLAAPELRELNRLTTLLLDIFEDQLAIGKLTLMSEAATLLDAQLANLNRAVLRHGGSISHEAAAAHAKQEYARFDDARRERRRLEAQEALAAIASSDKLLPKTRRSRKNPDKG